MISIPIAVHTKKFKWQLDFFWYNHKTTYGDLAKNKALAVIIKRNHPNDEKIEKLEWDIDIPHVMCESFFDYISPSLSWKNVPLNIQVGLKQIIDRFNDDEVIEILDCDMCHIRHHPFINAKDNCLIVDDIYEPWHLKSLSKNRHVIDIYFENGGRFYNGGFVPIIGKVKTFKKILPEWIAVHLDISKRYNNIDDRINWWAGMFALQAACEKNKIRMIAEDLCYVPNINSLKDNHYITHYSCAKNFDKKKYPDIDIAQFEHNLFFDRLRSWPRLFS